MLRTCPRSCCHSLATVSLLPPSDFIKICNFFGEKVHSEKKRAFPNCSGEKKKKKKENWSVPKLQTVPTKRLSIPEGKKKDTLLNTIKGIKQQMLLQSHAECLVLPHESRVPVVTVSLFSISLGFICFWEHEPWNHSQLASTHQGINLQSWGSLVDQNLVLWGTAVPSTAKALSVV